MAMACSLVVRSCRNPRNLIAVFVGADVAVVVVIAATVTFSGFVVAQDYVVVVDKYSDQLDCEISKVVVEVPVVESNSEDPVAKYLCCFPAPHPYTREGT